jgi:rubrerythrin
MGLLTAYLAYRYGKKKAEEAAEIVSAENQQICRNCGFPRFMHSEDDDCPI